MTPNCLHLRWIIKLSFRVDTSAEVFILVADISIGMRHDLGLRKYHLIDVLQGCAIRALLVRVATFRRAGSNLRAKRGQNSTRVARHIRVYLFMSVFSNLNTHPLTGQILRHVWNILLTQVPLLVRSHRVDFPCSLYDGDPWSCHLGREDWRWARTCRV